MATQNKGLLNSSSIPNNIERNMVKDDKVKLYKLMNTFVDLAKKPTLKNSSNNSNAKFDFNTWLSFESDKPIFLNHYDEFRLDFLKACSKLVENNVQFLKVTNSLADLSIKMDKIKMLISSLHDFIVNHGTFRELLRKKITEQNLKYWDDYYNYKQNNSNNVATRLEKLCNKAKDGDNFQDKLKACFTLIISLSLAYEFEIMNERE